MSRLAAIRRGYVSSSEDLRGKGSCLGNIFGFYKTRYILLSDSADCTVLRAVVLTQYRLVTDGQTDRQTDGQTDGIAVASTALAKRRTVKSSSITLNKHSTRAIQRAISQRSTPPLTSSKWGKLPKFVVFWTIATIKDEKSAAMFHLWPPCIAGCGHIYFHPVVSFYGRPM